MTTPSDIILQALKKSGVLGVGQSAAAEDMNDAFLDLNDMVAQWNRKRWLIWNLVDVSKVSTGALFYTVGPGQDFDVARPDKIESAFFRQFVSSLPNQVDWPLSIIESREIYNLIPLKNQGTWPNAVFYDSSVPFGKLYVWPVPQAGTYEIHISVKNTIAQFTGLAQQLVMPPEYVAALKWNLALRLRPSYQLAPDLSIIGLAKDSLNVIRNANTQISRLIMPGALMGKDRYNIFSDQSY